MAKKYSGGIILATGFRLDDPQPIDDRLVVTSSNSLTDPNFTNIYPGIIVSVSESNGSAYKWNGEDRTDINNWEKILVSSDTSSFAQTSNVISNSTFNTFSSSYSQSVIDFTESSQSIASEIDSFKSFSSSFSQSVVNFDSFSESIAESVTTQKITASSGIHFSSSGTFPKNYVIDYHKVFSSSIDSLGNTVIHDNLLLESGSLTITASGIKVEGDLDADGNIALDGTLSFSGFNFSQENIAISTGSTFFGSGSTGSMVQNTQHQFTGSVLITGSGVTLNSGILTIPNHAGDGTINVASVLASTATATNVVTNSTFNAFSSSYSQSVIDFTESSESIASEIDSFKSFSSSFSQSVVDFETTSQSLATAIISFESFSSSFSQSVVDFTESSQSIASEIDSFKSFSSSFSQSVIDFTDSSQSIASEINSFKSFSSSFSQSVVNFNSFSSSFSQSVVDFTESSESIASEIDSFKSFSSSFSQSVVDFNSFSESIATSLFVGALTASGNISASGHLFFSASATTATTHKILVQDPDTGQIFTTGSVGGGGGSDVATEITLGADTTGNLPLISSTTVQSSIDQINSILGLLAPTPPPNLSDISVGFKSNNFIGRGTNGAQTSSITIASPQFFTSSKAFFNGNEGTLTAFSSSDGGITFGIAGTRDLTTNSDTGLYVSMSITADGDPYVGQAGKEGFYKQLSASITTSFTNSSTKRVVNISHSITGLTPNFEFYVSNDSFTTISNRLFSYNESINGFHYQSGIKYLGDSSTFTSSFTVTIPSDRNFLNSEGRLALTGLSGLSNSSTVNDTNGFTPGQSTNVTKSLGISNNKFKVGDATLLFSRYKVSSLSTAASNLTVEDLLIDSMVEDETNPSDGAYTTFRSSSGKGHAPTFLLGNSDITKVGQSFDKTLALNSTNNFELQFSSGAFHWPTSVNYSSFTPAGPNYTGINSVGDDTNTFSENPMRYAFFNVGTIEDASGVDIVIQGAQGFDTTFGGDASFQQSSHDFQLGIIVMETGTNTRVTQWIDANTPHDQLSNTTLKDYDKGAVTGGTVASSGNLTRNITFGGVQKSGTVYVRIGYSYNTTRKFKYIYKI